ncbi:MAG TPA: long-chain-fatty-acid--CoA ligase [Balneolales bacterium]|nr:long-chain-fatty-acid--CoA ligase [Balneolales bacterium]
MLVGDIPRKNSKLFPQKTAVIEADVTINFSHLNQRINRLANAIIGLGIEKGDRIAVLSHNCHQYVEFYFAAAKAGTPIVPLNYRSNDKEISYILNDSEAKMLIFNAAYDSLVEQIKDKTENLKHLISFNGIIKGASDYEEVLSKASDIEPKVSLDEDDIAVLGYTGGTTGLPKGVMTTHKNIIASCYNTALERLISPETIFLNVPPMFHAGDANSMFAYSFVGATNVILDSFSPEGVLQNIEKHKVTSVLLVPSMVLFILQYPDVRKFDTKTLNTIYYGTAPMPLKPLRQAMDIFGCGFSQTYGTTETFVPISILKPKDHILDGDENMIKRMKSAGREVVGVQVKIVDKNNIELGINQIGEIIVKGDNVMKGYWKKPQLTQKVIKAGWYYTGDMGMIDDLGYIYIVDRKKDMIISGGENIYPKEVENVLYGHPAVVEASVIGVPDDIWGEVVKAFIIKKPNTDINENELIEYCAKHLARYKKPKSIDFVEQFPRSTAGKILKRELKKPFWTNKERKV